MSDDDDLLLLEPSDGAYEKCEHRVGPPLDYLGEQLEASRRNTGCTPMTAA